VGNNWCSAPEGDIMSNNTNENTINETIINKTNINKTNVKSLFSTFKKSFSEGYKKEMSKMKHASGFAQGYAAGRVIARIEGMDVNDPEYQGFCSGLSAAEIDSAK
jgi:hypothetical protein